MPKSKLSTVARFVPCPINRNGIHEACLVDANTRSTTNACAKLMKRLYLALTTLSLAAASTVLAGTPELQPAPSPTEEEVNHLNIFEYETTYTFNSDYKDYRGKFGDSDSL